MKRKLIPFLFLLFGVNLSFSQDWMTSLPIAQKLALVQNKMVLMVWEEATFQDYPVFIETSRGHLVFIKDLFFEDSINSFIWENFVPVIVGEYEYPDLYLAAKENRSQQYIDKLNDDSLKVMDINGNIVNLSLGGYDYINLTKLIENYAVNTTFITPELRNYAHEKTFYTAYFLASKYLDFALYLNKKVRSEFMALSTIYLMEAETLLSQEPFEEQESLKERLSLFKIQENLIEDKPRKVLRQLRRIEKSELKPANRPLAAFLYYTAYMLLEDDDNSNLWKTEVSSVNLKKAQAIINSND
jgi:hypothetical protein